MSEIRPEADPFTLEHLADSRAATAAEAEPFLVYALTDAERARAKWAELDDLSFWLLVLAVMAHPVLRDEVWDKLPDELRFWLTINAPENQGAANDLVRRAVRSFLAAWYIEEDEEARS
jgi:hypothetical protein